MSGEETKNNHKRDKVEEVIGILEELASALVMALLIIGFVVQPFIIPTGSMAETLKGAHFRLICPQCGYHYDRDYTASDFQLTNHRIVNGRVPPPASRCPACGYYNNLNQDSAITVSKGDKILALKGLYQFFEPKRWDVVVFRNPTGPSQNYIKRLIATPGETVEIIDGDIYINGQITRKPPKIQNELWMLVYDSDYIPVEPQDPRFNGHKWQVPMRNYGGGDWQFPADKPGVFVLDDITGNKHSLVYDTSIGNDFRTTYAYNRVTDYPQMPRCSDIKVSFYVDPDDEMKNFSIAAALRKYQRQYKASITANGRMKIVRQHPSFSKTLEEKTIELPSSNGPVLFSFVNVDHKLIFQYGDQELVHDLGKLPDSAGPKKAEAEPEVELIGTGKLQVSHIKIYRDTYYLSHYPQSQGWATEGNPLKLEEDEFFVLGDNSPFSQDGRWWNTMGIGNNDKQYRKGIVPREYMIGKAFVVFWPSGYKPFEKFPFHIVPNMRQMRLIYGGSGRQN